MLQDVQADATVRVNVRVEHLREELDFRCLVRVLFCKFDGQVEAAAFPDGVVGPENNGVPVEKRVARWRRLDALMGCVLVHALKVLEQASLGVRTHI